MFNLIKKIFAGREIGYDQKLESSYKQQTKYLRKVWNDDSYGLERILRLFLCLMQFVYPILLIREIFGRFGGIPRKLAVEFYTLLKLIFPFIILYFGLFRNPAFIAIVVYLLSETVSHILNLIFLSDIHSASVSYRRSMLLLFMHYIEVVADFAVFYIGFNLVNVPLTWVSAFYFSMVANTTVGFGEIHAQGPAGQFVVSAQLLVAIIFIILFIDYFSHKKE